MTINLADLRVGDHYLISNEKGEWQYLGFKENKYLFSRKAVGTNRLIRIKLSLQSAKRRVWKEVETLNLEADTNDRHHIAI